MPIPIKLPPIASDFEAGTIAGWHKAIGDAVRKGDPLFDVESDKAVVSVEAEDSGVLGVIQIPEGSQDVPVNTILGFLLSEGETAADIVPDGVVSAPRNALSEEPGPGSTVIQPFEVRPLAGRVFASPAARRVAAERNIDVSTVVGRGPGGRVLKADVEAAAGEPAIPEAFGATPPSEPPRPAAIDLPNSKMRSVIAKRLTAAKRDIPHFYLTVECELDALLTLRQQLNEHLLAAGIKISINDCVIKAAALALVDVPEANASWSEEAVHQYGTVDISVAVATADGLLTPIVRNADRKSLRAIAQEMKTLAARAVAGTLKPDEFRGGGFSISNLGMYGIKQFSAIINPPQSCILAVGASEKRAIVRADQLAIATTMTVTLSVDHRSVDGAVGARFLAAFKKFIEHPIVLLLADA